LPLDQQRHQRDSLTDDQVLRLMMNAFRKRGVSVVRLDELLAREFADVPVTAVATALATGEVSLTQSRGVLYVRRKAEPN
jgi:hypothetical protein